MRIIPGIPPGDLVLGGERRTKRHIFIMLLLFATAQYRHHPQASRFDSTAAKHLLYEQKAEQRQERLTASWGWQVRALSTSTCTAASTMESYQQGAGGSLTSTYYPCVDIVDYDFYTGDGSTIATLNEAAIRHLSNPLFNIIPSSCKEAIKRAICARIFRKCPSGWETASSSGASTSSSLIAGRRTKYSKGIAAEGSEGGAQIAPPVIREEAGSLLDDMPVEQTGESSSRAFFASAVSITPLQSQSSLPYQRACRSVCDDVTITCAGLLQIFDTGDSWLDQNVLNCTGRLSAAELASYGFTGWGQSNLPYIYDQKAYNNTAASAGGSCHLPSAAVIIADAVETYVGLLNSSTATKNIMITSGSSGYEDPVAYAACAGISTQVYIPAEGISPYLLSGSSISGGANPLGRPFAYQNATELALRSFFASLPSWLGGKCYTSLRRLMCAALMPAATTSTLREVIYSSSSLAASNGGVQRALWDLLVSGFNSSSSEDNASSYEIALPSYPDESLCTDFQTHCGGPLSDLWMSGTLAGKEATRLQRLLNRTCTQYSASGTTSSTVGQLKLSDATISYISSRVSSASTNSFSATVNLTSPTRNMSSAAGGDALSQLKEWGSCPHGYVIPDDPDHTHNKWMAGTQCAQACRYRYATVVTKRIYRGCSVLVLCNTMIEEWNAHLYCCLLPFVHTSGPRIPLRRPIKSSIR